MSVRKKWSFTTAFQIEIFHIKHIDLLLFLLIGFLFIGLLNFFSKSKISDSLIIFREDNAFNDKTENDLLNYTRIAEKIRAKVLPQTFTCSFTIGIIGPWGNGKSSLINLLANQFIDKDIIPVHFHPYLNHTEAEISSEFFHAFQSALKPYSGKLSNLIIEYSNKLLNLYNDKKIDAFYSDGFSNIKSSAHDNLASINKTLRDINKKIIVFVDDLDRLSQDEILQVLKLIRNTANFTNTVFIVAMDKGYILDRLNADISISSNKFIDKFFQLEIYLPEIDNSILKKEFINILTNTISIGEQTIIELENLLASGKILFDDHIQNLRDVKRVCNQIIFEYDFINEEVKISDFINFIFLKLAFPRFLDLLKSKPENFLDKHSSYYSLKEIKTNDSNKNFFDLLQTSEDLSLKQYDIYTQLFPSDDNSEIYMNISFEKKKLLLKTLAYLFGKENQIEAANSIRFENNFRRFLQLDYNNSYFLNKNFNEIIALNTFDKLRTSIQNILFNNQHIELLDRLKYFTATNDFEFKNSLIIYALLFEEGVPDKLTDIAILQNMALQIEIYSSDRNIEMDFQRWIVENIFETKNLRESTQLKIIGYLWEKKKTETLWNIPIDRLKEIVLTKYTNYLKEFDSQLWSVNDYSFYSIYHKIKTIDGLNNNLIAIFLDFLNRNKIETFCSQSTEFAGFYGERFKVTNAITDFFQSKENYHQFIKNHKDAKTEPILEYLRFLKLLSISKFSIEIAFNFKSLTLINDKYNQGKEKYRESYEEKKRNTVQIFFKIPSKNVYEFLYINGGEYNDSSYRLVDFKFFKHENEYYSILSHDLGKDNKHIKEYGKLLFDKLSQEYGIAVKLIDAPPEKFVINIEGQGAINIFSIQPE